MRILIIAFAFGSVTLSAQTNMPPRGYRMPTDADFTDSWKENRATNPTPFHSQADFNGDGIQDDVWLLPTTSKSGFGVFVSLGSRAGQPRLVRLYSTRKEAPQNYGVETADAGRYETACGKGYGDFACAHGEPDELNLKLPGIWLYLSESSTSIYWWDVKAQRFRETLISD